MVEKLIGRFCGDVRFSIKVKLRLLQFFLFGFFWQNNFYLSSVGELLLQKTALVRMIKKDNYSVKNKSSNVIVIRMGKCYLRFPSSHFFVLCPRRKLKKDRATDSNIAYSLYKPKKPIRM